MRGVQMVARGRGVSAHSLAPRHIYNYRGRVHGTARTTLRRRIDKSKF